jgi:hypothetical protein
VRVFSGQTDCNSAKPDNLRKALVVKAMLEESVRLSNVRVTGKDTKALRLGE